MSTLEPVMGAPLHTPPSDVPTITSHTSNIHSPPLTPTATPPSSHTAYSTTTTTPHSTSVNDPLPSYRYTHLPLPDLQPTDIHLISHNINTLHTTMLAELGAILDSYSALQPNILGLQEMNKNWTIYDKTEGPLRTLVTHQWPGAKIVTAHCKDDVFQTLHQPGGVAQLLLNKLTGRVIDHGRDDLGRYAWQTILLDGKCNLVIITTYRVTQDSVSTCGYHTACNAAMAEAQI